LFGWLVGWLVGLKFNAITINTQCFLSTYI
jgi:hypothetical protein